MRLAFSTALLFVVVVPTYSQTPGTIARALPFTDGGWTLGGAKTASSRVDGREVLSMETGTAERRDVSLLDGTIDFDVKVTRRRSFVYVHFRMLSSDEHEEMYLRPHKSGLPDALQYAPVWQGESAWQLHHGPGGTGAIEFTPGVWTHVRVALEGRHAALFVGDMKAPALLVPELSREPRAGHIGLGSFLPTGVPGAGPIAEFSNVVVRAGASGVDFDAAIAAVPKTPASNALVVREWAVSKAFALAPLAPVPSLPATPDPYQIVAAEPNGRVQLHRSVALPGTPLAAAVARVSITTRTAGIYPMDLGFSDIATVFLNGRPVFTRDDSYSYDRPRREGLIGMDQARVYLPLNAGTNELSILVGDKFGGWGLMAQFPQPAGLTLRQITRQQIVR